jgi:hypothetical protein
VQVRHEQGPGYLVLCNGVSTTIVNKSVTMTVPPPVRVGVIDQRPAARRRKGNSVP